MMIKGPCKVTFGGFSYVTQSVSIMAKPAGEINAVVVALLKQSAIHTGWITRFLPRYEFQEWEMN